jgi:hypothetical protein
MWEYNNETYTNKSKTEIIQILNELGQLGWEIVQYNEENAKPTDKKQNSKYSVFMKRKIVEKTNKNLLLS